MKSLLKLMAAIPFVVPTASCTIVVPPPAPKIAPKTHVDGNTHRAVGIIKCGVSKKHAFVIEDRRVIMTIGHFLPSFPKVRSPSACEFIVGGYGARPFRTRVTLHATALDEDESLEDDWAVLVTAKPVPTTPMRLGRYSDIQENMDVRVMHYSDTWNSHFVYSPKPCEIFPIVGAEHTFQYECAGRMPYKGAPLVVFDGVNDLVVGITARHNRAGVGLVGRPAGAINSAINSLRTQEWRY